MAKTKMITGTLLNTDYTSLVQGIYTAEAIGDAAAVPAGASRVDMTGLLSSTDASDPVNKATISLDTTTAAQPGPNDWTDGTENWSGGIITNKDGSQGPNYPSIGMPLDPTVTFVRVRVTPGLALSIGGKVRFS